MPCPKCTGPSRNGLCLSCKQEDYDLSGNCSESGCENEVTLVEVCEECSDTAQSAREGAGTIITGPDADDYHVVGGDTR